MKAVILSFLLVLGCRGVAENQSTLTYVKMGLFADFESEGLLLPSLGMGWRSQKEQYGIDLSANFSSLFFVSDASVKGHFLFYPYPTKRNQFFYGIGPGVGYHESFPADAGGYFALEGMVGYEFRHTHYLKTFVQLEVTQPLVHFYSPTASLLAGIGF